MEIGYQLGIALGLGLLVGLQRERASEGVAGVRTFPLITILGALSAILGRDLGGWVVASGLLAVGGMPILGNTAQLKQEALGPGITTEIAALVMFSVGALLALGHMAPAIAVGGGVPRQRRARSCPHARQSCRRVPACRRAWPDDPFSRLFVCTWGTTRLTRACFPWSTITCSAQPLEELPSTQHRSRVKQAYQRTTGGRPHMTT